MCVGALLLARVERVVYGAAEPKFGALGSRIAVQEIEGLNHGFEIEGGVMANEAAALLQTFFRDVRRGAGAVERGGLENRCGGNSTEGSNPSLSASFDPEARKRSRAFGP